MLGFIGSETANRKEWHPEEALLCQRPLFTSFPDPLISTQTRHAAGRQRVGRITHRSSWLRRLGRTADESRTIEAAITRYLCNEEVDGGLYRPRKRAFFFCINADSPSRKSSVPACVTSRCRSRSSCVSSIGNSVALTSALAPPKAVVGPWAS